MIYFSAKNFVNKILKNFSSIIEVDVLVTPIRVVKRLADLQDFEISDLFQTVQKVQIVVEKVHNTSSSTIVVQVICCISSM